MEKRILVAEIKARLEHAGYRVTQEDIGDGFRSAVPGRYCPALLKAWNIANVDKLADFLISRGVPMLSPVGLELGDWSAKKAKAAAIEAQKTAKKAAAETERQAVAKATAERQEEEVLLEKHLHFQNLARRAQHRGRTCLACGYHDPDGRYGVPCPSCELPIHLAPAI